MRGALSSGGALLALYTPPYMRTLKNPCPGKEEEEEWTRVLDEMLEAPSCDVTPRGVYLTQVKARLGVWASQNKLFAKPYLFFRAASLSNWPPSLSMSDFLREMEGCT